MLVRLMYASRAVPAVDQEELQAILKRSKANNSRTGITGALCLCSNERIFIQVLEGGREAVNSLYRRILADTRHTDPVLLHYQEIDERRFDDVGDQVHHLIRRRVALHAECVRWAARGDLVERQRDLELVENLPDGVIETVGPCPIGRRRRVRDFSGPVALG